MPTVVRNNKIAVKKKSDMSSRVFGLEDIDEQKIKMLVYGHSGTGKTRFAGTFSSLGPVLHLVCSGNGMNESRSIRGMKGIRVAQIQEPDDLPNFCKYAQEEGITTIVLDHVTEYCNLVLAKLLGLERLPEQQSWGMAKQQHYQQMGLQVKEYLRELFDVDANILVLGQQRTYDSSEDDEGNLLMPYVSVAATPAVAGWLAPACDYVVQTYKQKVQEIVEKKLAGKVIRTKSKGDKVQYLLRTGPSEIYNTKFRVPVGVELPDYIVNPSYDKIKHLL